MKRALIGYTGFVGTTLLKQTKFEHQFRSSNIQDIRHQTFDTVVCAGAPAQKWIANAKPEEDSKNIDELISHLKEVKTDLFILISTVDVFKDPNGADENTNIIEDGLHAYGLNRRKLEKFVQSHFENHLIVRLPGLVGPGLRKNVIFDFLNENNLNKIESRGSFQFYPMVNLWSDIQISLKNKLKTIHLTAAPVLVKEIAKEAFNLDFTNELPGTPAAYDFQSIHGSLYGSQTRYQYSLRETLLATRAYAQSEMRTI